MNLWLRVAASDLHTYVVLASFVLATDTHTQIENLHLIIK